MRGHGLLDDSPFDVDAKLLPSAALQFDKFLDKLLLQADVLFKLPRLHCCLAILMPRLVLSCDRAGERVLNSSWPATELDGSALVESLGPS